MHVCVEPAISGMTGHQMTAVPANLTTPCPLRAQGWGEVLRSAIALVLSSTVPLPFDALLALLALLALTQTSSAPVRGSSSTARTTQAANLRAASASSLRHGRCYALSHAHAHHALPVFLS